MTVPWMIVVFVDSVVLLFIDVIIVGQYYYLMTSIVDIWQKAAWKLLQR